MSIPGGSNPLLLTSAAGGAGGGYLISRSVRFNSSDSAKCARTYSSGSSTTTQTFALWIKRAKLGATGCFWSGYDGSAAYGAYFQFDSGDTLTVILGGASLYQLTTTQVFRDASAWYHIVLNIDTNNATSSDRIRLYVNGSRVTTFSTASYPTSGYACQFAMGNANNTIGTTWGSSAYSFFDGYLADIHFCDGTAYDASAFGEFDANGIWQPKKFAGVYGTNGFKLNFSDNSTAAALGTDTSGNGNTWTVNNLSVTAGAGNDSLVDVPTNGSEVDTGSGGQVRGNYCTWNPLGSTGATLTNGNLDAQIAAGNTTNCAVGTIGVTSGKWYWEVVASSASVSEVVGICDLAAANKTYTTTGGWVYWSFNGNKIHNNSGVSYGATWTTGDVIGVALNMDVGEVTFYKNGVSQGVAYNTGLSGKTIAPMVGDPSGASTRNYTANFGQRPFAYPLSGFKALCTANLPAPVVTKPNTVMDVALWTGSSTSSARTISGLQFSPDLVWAKSRSLAYSHNLYDTVRGTGKGLYSDSTGAESTNNIYGYISAFNSDGFTATPGSTDNGFFNETNATYAAWCWDAGSSTVTDNTGSISSQVRANASAGFSVVTYTGNGTAGATVGHGLGVSPQLIIAKRRNGAVEWPVYHAGAGANKYLYLNTTAAAVTDTVMWNNSTPSSTTFSIGSYSDINANTGTYVAYCFAPVVGYSSMGSYTGDGSTSGFGPFIHCGFRPKFVLIKGSSVAHDWLMLDAVRNPYNLTTQVLYANSSTAEMTNNGVGSGGYESIDILSNGFQIKSNSARYNQSGATYIYFAVAESPFQYARAR